MSAPHPRIEIGERSHQLHQLKLSRQPVAGEDSLEVPAHRVHRHAPGEGGLAHRESLGEQYRDGALRRGEPKQRSHLTRIELLPPLRIDHEHERSDAALAESLSVDAARTTVPTLIAALFYDLSREKEVKIPTQGEKRERELRKLVVRSGKPVALFIDEAHDLHGRTLNGLKRLMEVVGRGGGNLSVVLIGHPKLRNDLRRPTMEEIGHRTDVLAFEGLGEDTRAYLDWLLGECAEDGVEVDTLIEPTALDLMAMRLSTPLQFAEHLNRAFEAGFRMGQQPITADIVAATLAPDFDDLEPRLIRQGYSVKVLAEQFHARPAEIRRFLNGQLDPGRTRELADRMRAVGLAL